MSATVVWVPSPARTLVLFASAGSTPKGRQITPVPLRWPAKQPGDVLDYSLDISGFLADVEDQPVTVTATPVSLQLGDISINSITIAGGLITLWLSGGLPGTDYVFEITAQTLAGRTVNAACLISAISGLPAPSPPSTPPTPVSWNLAHGMDFRSGSNLLNYLLLF